MKTLSYNNKLTALLSALIILNLLIAVFGGDAKSANVGPGNKNEIEIKDFHFNPQTLTVKSGETITWTNRDEEPHTVVSVEKQFKKSPPLDTDQSFTVTAGAPGTYTYFCSVHPKMTGTIVVVKS
jgi:plastocyanin